MEFESVWRILVNHKGKDSAITIEQLAFLAGLPNRRSCEDLLETRLNQFPFPLVADSNGVYIPVTADEINHCLNSLRGRAIKIFRRRKILTSKASATGFPRLGKAFADPPAVQKELALIC